MKDTLSGYHASQNENELSAFIEFLREHNVESYLEIGARHGDSFYEIMKALPLGARGVAVDLPGGNWGTESSRDALNYACTVLTSLGYAVSSVFGNSASSGVRTIVAGRGPYDAVLIDGDHQYDVVKKDWEYYGTLAPIVAFHDIAGEGQSTKKGSMRVEVPRLWVELKQQHRHIEFIDENSKMGIGVILR